MRPCSAQVTQAAMGVSCMLLIVTPHSRTNTRLYDAVGDFLSVLGRSMGLYFLRSSQSVLLIVRFRIALSLKTDSHNA